MTLPAFTIVELSGHIIDSLTLAKVIDKIQASGSRYQINDLQIGEKKNDFSYAQISLWHEDEAALNAMLEELKVYGAHPLQAESAQLAVCPADATLPPGSYTRHNPPTEINLNGVWTRVDRQGLDLAIKIDPHTRTAQLTRVSDLKQGDQVVVGKAGVRVLPELGENVHAQPLAR